MVLELDEVRAKVVLELDEVGWKVMLGLVVLGLELDERGLDVVPELDD